MEIERKFLIEKLPSDIDLSSYKCRHIEQGYLCSEPVVRVRRDNEDYYLTSKSKGLMVREEYNLPLTAEAYNSLIKKADGYIKSVRYQRDTQAPQYDAERGYHSRNDYCSRICKFRGCPLPITPVERRRKTFKRSPCLIHPFSPF